jgi:hypothetical protein
MQFAHGLKLDINSVNEILEIAQKKKYLSHKFTIKCDSFRFIFEEKKFLFYLSKPNISIELEMEKFIECYGQFLTDSLAHK